MKLLVEKLPLTEDSSFVARVHRTPNFEVPWHQHIELELILFTEGAGLSFVGNYVGEFEVGDIFFLGSNLPHTFQKSGDLITSAVVVHFKEDFWGQDFLKMKECKNIHSLFNKAFQGLKITGKTKDLLNPLIQSLAAEKGLSKLITLLECLNHLAETEEYTTLSTQDKKQLNTKNKERIDRIFQYTMDNFKDPITLNNIAEVANMSIPAFCNYFKKSTKKNYIEFLNEVRIGYACNLIIENQTNITEACYQSGFNTIANFNRQFLKIKGMTPSSFKKHLQKVS